MSVLLDAKGSLMHLCQLPYVAQTAFSLLCMLQTDYITALIWLTLPCICTPSTQKLIKHLPSNNCLLAEQDAAGK